MTSNFKSVTTLPLEALESMGLGTLERSEVEELKRHAWATSFSIQCDNYASIKGLMPLSRRWGRVETRCKRELETRFEMEI